MENTPRQEDTGKTVKESGIYIIYHKIEKEDRSRTTSKEIKENSDIYNNIIYIAEFKGLMWK